MEKAGDFDAMPKKEALRHRRELEKLRRNLGGIRDLDKLPDAVFVIDTKKEHIAVTEANKLGMPIVAVVDTNCDPDVITYVIPGNDDAIRSGALMCRVMAEAVIEGRYVAAQRPAAPVARHAAPRLVCPQPAPAGDANGHRHAAPLPRLRPPTDESASAPADGTGARATSEPGGDGHARLAAAATTTTTDPDTTDYNRTRTPRHGDDRVDSGVERGGLTCRPFPPRTSSASAR